jgi:hypothetical protein
MTYAARPSDFHADIAPARRAVATAPRRGLLSRLFNAIVDSRERQATRDAETYLARTGHRFTDSVERELNERFFNGGWNARR